MVDLIDAEVERNPEALAVVGDDAVVTYGELDELANRIAHALDRADPGRTRVHGGVLVDPGARPVVAMVGVAKSGRAIVPLDTDSPPERLVELGRQTGPMVVVTDRRHATLLDSSTPTVVLEELADDLPTKRPNLPISPESGFLVNFTSGSTGRPKGALRNHRAQMHSVYTHATVSGYRPGARLGLVHGVAFAASRVTIWCGLGNGCSLHVRDARTHGPRGLASWLASERIAILLAPASLIDAMIEQDPPEEVLEHLDRVTFSGDVLRVDTVRRLQPFLRPDAEIHNAYGSSEIGGVATFRMRADDPLEGELVPAGRIRQDVEVRIVDPDDRGVGEIEVSGVMVAVRYIDDTTDARGSYREEGERRWFRSGDLGRIRADGLLEVHGRLDDRVKIRGQTIDPAEVERALRRHADVADVHVGARTVRGRDRLVAWVEPAAGSSPTVSGLRSGLRDELPGWMAPQSVVLVDRMLRTERGKIDRAGLAAPGSERPPLGVAFERPRTPVEQRLADAFGDVLGLDEVGRDDEFFDLGGDSLAAVEVIDRVGRALGEDLPTDAFLEAATPRALAARLQAEPQSDDERLVALQPSGGGVPVVLVHAGHGFVITYDHLARSLAGRRAAFGLQMLTRDRARDLFSLPGLAHRYADLLERRLRGPLIIAGFSGGSPLAHALSAELSGRGRSVPACVLLDPVHPGRRRRPTKALAYDLVSCTPVRLRPHQITQQRMAAAERGSRRYRPDAIPVPIVVARAELACPERWTGLTSVGLTVVDVPGDHVSMLHPPHSVALGERLEPLLQRLEAERPSQSVGSADQ